MGGQPGKPKPIGNPPIRYEPQRRPPMEEPPRPIPPPPVERPPLPAAVRPASKNSTPFPADREAVALVAGSTGCVVNAPHVGLADRQPYPHPEGTEIIARDNISPRLAMIATESQSTTTGSRR